MEDYATDFVHWNGNLYSVTRQFENWQIRDLRKEEPVEMMG